jgi:hypothetical protein
MTIRTIIDRLSSRYLETKDVGIQVRENKSII